MPRSVIRELPRMHWPYVKPEVPLVWYDERGPGFEDQAGSFTRNTSGTYWDKNRVLQTAGIDEPRCDYDPLTGAYRGLLIEQQATNLHPNSNTVPTPIDFSVRQLSSSVVQTLTPDGSSNGQSGRIEINQLGGFARTQQSFETARSVLFLAKSDSEKCYMFLTGADSIYTIIDLNTGTITTDNDDNGVSISRATNGWFIVSVTGTYIRIGLCSSPNNYDEGELGIAALIWGLTYVDSSTPPITPIITDGVPATRSKDNARFTDPSLFNNYEQGAFVVEFSTQSLAGSNGDSALNPILSRDGTQYRFLYQRNDTSLASYDASISESSRIREVPAGSKIWAISWSGNIRTEACNGIVFEPYAWNSWGNDGDLLVGEAGWSGWIKKIRFYPDPLSNDELQRLTAPEGI